MKKSSRALSQVASIDPIYTMQHANEQIALGTHEVVFQSSGHETTAPVTFSMRFRPYPRLHGDVTTGEPGLIVLDAGADISLRSLNGRFRPLQTGLVSSLQPCREPIEIRHVEKPRLCKVIFHLVNFYDILGGNHDVASKKNAGKNGLAQIVLEEAGWKVELHPVNHVKDLVSQLNREGGYAITHVGSISRRRGGSFTPRAAKHVLETLGCFCHLRAGLLQVVCCRSV